MSVYGDRRCYYLDQTWSTGDVPCYGTGTTQCCQPDDTCTTGGFCIDGNYTVTDDSRYYTGTCTDQLYGPGCKNLCPAATTGTAIQQCSDNTWCCILDGDAACCDGDAVFTTDLGANITTEQRLTPSGAASDDAASNSTGGSTGLESPQPSSSSGTSAGAAAGIGIGAALGVLLLGCIAAFTIYRMRRNRNIRRGQELDYSPPSTTAAWQWKPAPNEKKYMPAERHELQEQEPAIELPSESKPLY